MLAFYMVYYKKHLVLYTTKRPVTNSFDSEKLILVSTFLRNPLIRLIGHKKYAAGDIPQLRIYEKDRLLGAIFFVPVWISMLFCTPISECLVKEIYCYPIRTLHTMQKYSLDNDKLVPSLPNTAQYFFSSLTSNGADSKAHLKRENFTHHNLYIFKRRFLVISIPIFFRASFRSSYN